VASSWQQQALIEAPVRRIWELLEDPARYPEWASDAISTTGFPTEIEKGSTFEQTGPGPFGRPMKTTYKVEELDDLREIKLRCQRTGYYSHWRLTEAQGQTFADLELGVEPIGLFGRVIDLALTKNEMRKMADLSLDGLRQATAE
jgi:Polyketide cyclase / dehydrase and lipid transport